MKCSLVTAPVLEPITLAELKLHLRLDSETFAGDLATYQSILPGSHGIHELMTLDVAPGGAGWAVGDTITGSVSTKTCVIAAVLTTKTYYVRDRSGAFTLGEILSNGTATADQGAANPTFATGFYLIGDWVDVLGKTAVVNLGPGVIGAGGTIEAKIQESDDAITGADVTGGAFSTVTGASHALQEKAYTGTKRYIRVIARILVAACEFGADVIVNAATTADDTNLTDAITDGREEAEKITQRCLLTQTWDYFLDAWPCGDSIRLPYGNLQNAAGTAPIVTWKDTDGTVTTLTAGTDYLVETNGDQCGRIVLPYGVSWPSGTLYPSNPITIRFVCGWTAAADIPKNIKRAVKFAAEDAYYHGDRHEILKPVIDNLLTTWRLWEF